VNKEVAKLWVDALTSGQYKQGKRALRKEDQFCCLGVLCDLAEKAGLGSWEEVGDRHRFTDSDGVYSAGFLTEAVLTWAGMKSNIGWMSGIPVYAKKFPDLKMYSLANMNDAGFTFPEIADFIEEHYEIL
jgi:hypothetical protein